MKTLAVVILTRNEEDNIVEVVQNAKQCTEEVLIIDSGSTDNTQALAEEQGARVCYHAWDGDFSAQRNFAISVTEADWILYMDADERMRPEMVARIRQILQQDGMEKQYRMKRKSVSFGVTFQHGVLYPDRVLRMFPRTQVHWVNKVHEHPECALPVEDLPGYLEHYAYQSWQEWEEKLCRYTTIWAEDAYRHGKRTSLLGVFTHSVGGFCKMFFAKLGFLDGLLGSYLCCTHFFYTMLKYLKLYERQQKEMQEAARSGREP